jgi:hypothetical protein
MHLSFPHTCYMAGPFHSLRFDDPNNIWREVQIIKLIIVYLLVTRYIFMSILKWVIRLRIMSIIPSSKVLWTQHVVLYKHYLTKESKPNRKLYFSSC